MTTPWLTERHGYDPTCVCLIAMYENAKKKVGGQAVLGRQRAMTTPWVTERNG